MIRQNHMAGENITYLDKPWIRCNNSYIYFLEQRLDNGQN